MLKRVQHDGNLLLEISNNIKYHEIMSRIFSVLLILFLPVILIFDLMLFLNTKVTCLSCEFGDYFRNTSLSAAVVMQAYSAVRGKPA